MSGEIRYCLECAWTQQASEDGHCQTCGSDALISPQDSKTFQIARARSVNECRRIFALEYEPDYRDEEGYTDNKAELAQWWNKI